jgi:tetratricopeptide (TPR) repeat protein
MTPTDYCTLARTLGRQGRLTDALGVARAGADAFPDDGGVWQTLGLVAHAADDFHAARYALEAASVLIPLAVPAQLALADTYTKFGQRGVARTILRHTAKEVRDHEALWPAVATLLRRAGAPKAALRLWRRMAVRHPGLADAHYQIAHCLKALGAGPAGLLEPLTEACLLAPGAVPYHLALAEAWVALREFAQAARVLAEVDVSAVACTGCLMRMAAVFQTAGETDRAIDCRTRALAEDFGCTKTQT